MLFSFCNKQSVCNSQTYLTQVRMKSDRNEKVEVTLLSCIIPQELCVALLCDFHIIIMVAFVEKWDMKIK